MSNIEDDYRRCLYNKTSQQKDFKQEQEGTTCFINYEKASNQIRRQDI